MAEPNNNTPASDKSTTTTLVNFLDAPKKKRKGYVVIALGSAVSPDIQNRIESFVRANFKSLFIFKPTNPEEFVKNANRDYRLVIMDDEYAEMAPLIQSIKSVKQKKQDSEMPILFLTRNADTLIAAYHKDLLAYQETDDYINYMKVSTETILNKIKQGLSGELRRRSRRYNIDLPITFYQIRHNRTGKGRIVDMSLHGAQIISDNDIIFGMKEQVRISLPLYRYLKVPRGDFLSLSCRVRRIFISGNKAGLSFEYMTEDKINSLTEFLIRFARQQTSRRAG